MRARSRRLRRYVVIAVLSVPVVAGAFVWQHPAILAAAGLFETVLNTLSEQYVDTIPIDSLYLRAARGLVQEFRDPFTKLYTPAEWEQTEGSLNGSFTGIGVSLHVEPVGVYLRMVYPGAPAALAGLHIGDRIIQVDTMRFVPGMTAQQTSGHIVGPAGTQVHLTVVREALKSSRSDTLQFTLTRTPVRLPAVPFTLLLDGHVGYIPFRQFIPNSADEVHAAIDMLRRAGATKFILDLRGNPGGFVDEAISLCGFFLPPNQVVVRMRGRSGEDAERTGSIPPVAPSAPLVVLVDPETASASEVTSGALQDHDRAAIIGRPTYGKGVAQSTRKLLNGYELKLTTAHWYTPLGRSIQRERTLLSSGDYVEVHPESLKTAAEKRARPTYKSDAGRTLYGGGGIVPDFVMRDTLEAGGALFIAALKPNVWRMQSVLSSYAGSLARVKPGQVHVTPVMRAAFLHRLRMSGIVIPQTVATAAGPFIDRLIAERVAFIKGDLPTAKQIELGNDMMLTLALSTLQQATDQGSLFTLLQKREGAAPAP
jgi:carboxyl-terminal processing protease